MPDPVTLTPPPAAATGDAATRRTRLRPAVRTLHLLLAVVGGVLLSIVTLSGALVVFRTELDWLHADTHGISATRGVAIDATAEAIALRHPGVRIQRLLTPAFTGAGDEWVLRDERGTTDVADDEVWKVFTDPLSGRFLGDTRGAASAGFLAWMAQFHHHLWLGHTGGILVGSAGLCLLGFIATGVWLWWPGVRRLGTALRLRWSKAGFVRTYDLHAWLGLAGIPLFLVIAITGAMFEFRWMRSAVHYGLGGSEADRPLALRTAASTSTEGKPRTAAGLTFGGAIAAAEAALPGTSALSISPPRPGRADAAWSVLLDYRWNVGSYSGALVQLNHDGSPRLVLDPRTMSVGGWANGQLWGLHTGTWGGAFSKTLYLVVGLLPPALLVTGILLWWYRHRQRRLVSAARAGLRPGSPPG